jgi:hypothetical protein
MITIIALFAGRRRILHIEPDSQYPQMWRVRWPDGTLSEPVNIARAKAAALDYAEGVEALKNRHKSPLNLLGNFLWSRSPVAPIARRAPKAAPTPVFRSAGLRCRSIPVPRT